MKRKLFFLGGLLLTAVLIVMGIYFHIDYQEKAQITVGYCIMDARNEALYFRKNTFAGGLYRKDGTAEESQKISSDSPEDILVTESAVLYTLEKDKLVRYDPDIGRKDTIEASRSDVEFSTSIAAFDSENYSPSGWNDSLQFAESSLGKPVLFRDADWGGTELFQYDKETHTLSAWIRVEGIGARQVAVHGSDIYICNAGVLYRINSNTQDVKLLYGGDDCPSIHRFIITEGNQVFVHAGRTLFLLQEKDKNVTPKELGIVDTGPYLHDNRIYTVGAGELYMYAEDGSLLGKAAGFDQIFELSVTKDGIFSYHLSQQIDFHTYEELGFN